MAGLEPATTVTVNEQGEVRESKDLDMPFGAYERKYEKRLVEVQRCMARRYQKVYVNPQTVKDSVG